MSGPRRWLSRLTLALPFLAAPVLALFAAELWLRITTNLPFVSRTHCFTQSKEEVPGFLPNCSETLRTPAGEVAFHTNELGHRDRSLTEFQGGAIAALGDSYVEGFWLPEEQGLLRAIERRLGWKLPLLNLGIRATGPSQQAIRLFRAWRQVPLQGVIWFLDPSDPLDEVLFRARNPELRIRREGWGELQPLFTLSPAYLAWTRWSLAFRDRIYVLLYIAERWIKQGSQHELLESRAFQPARDCAGLALAAAELKQAGLPLLFVAIPHGMPEAERPYMGRQLDAASFEALLGCARATGAPLLDLREALHGEGSWYFRNDWHFNREGAEAAAARAAPAIRAAWKELR